MDIQKFVETLLGYENIEVHGFEIETEQNHDEIIFVAKVELVDDEKYRCPECNTKSGKYGYQKNRFKRWRSLDLGKFRFYIECSAPRCICPEHGVRTAKIPWAFPDSDYTYAFDMQVAYCAAKLPTNFVARKYRIKWGTVGNCVKRVQKNVSCFKPQNFKNLRKIGIDETSYLKGHKYLTTVQNLETGEIVWAADGFGDEVLAQFFEQLSSEERDGIKHVAADGARWITRMVEKYCPNAIRSIDPFHVVGWATKELDNVRKRIAKDAKKNDLPC